MKNAVMTAKWSEDLTVKFVELYKHHECLWNTKIPKYRDKTARNKALIQITKDMPVEGLAVYEIKQKIKNLRSTYCQELAKIRNYRKFNRDYVPHVKWFRTMHSCIKGVKRCHYRERMVTAAESNVIDEVLNNAGINSQEDSFAADSSIYIKNEFPAITDVSYQNENVSNLNHTDAAHLPSTSKSDSERPRETKEPKNSSLAECSGQATDGGIVNDAFGSYVAATLNAMLTEHSILAQDEIHRVLTKYRLADLRSRMGHDS